MPGLFVPQGELETLGIGKETTFGTLATLSMWHCFTQHQPKIMTAGVKRAPRASVADPYPATGGRTVSSSLDVETDADTFPQWLAYSLGAQAAPTTTLVNTTVASTQAMGSATLVLTSTIGIFPGMVLTVDTAGNMETLTVASISGINTVTFTTNTTKSHNAGVAVTLTATGAYLTVMKLGSPLPSFSMEVNRPGSAGSTATDYLGCAVDQLSLSMAAKQGLTAKLSLVAQDAVQQASPTSATLSSKNQYVFEQQNCNPQIGGELVGGGSGASLVSMAVTVNNNLTKDYFTFGSGNRVRSFPENVRSVSGTLTLGFESAAQLTNFNAARTGGALPSISALLPFYNTDQIGSSGINYAFALYFPKLFLSQFGLTDDTSKMIQQTLSFTAAESVPSANDQMSAYCIGGNSAIF